MFSRREAAITAGTLLLVAGGWWLIRARAERAERAAPAALAFATFENLTGDAGADWVRVGIAEALSRQLAGARDVRVMVARNAGDGVAFGASHVVYGRVERGARGAELHWTLESAKRKSVIASGKRDVGVGKWAGELRALAGQILEELRTGSPVAPMELHNDDAVAAFGRADYAGCVAADPLAGWCWKELAEAELRGGRREVAQKAFSDAAARQLTAQSRAQLEFMRAQTTRDRAAEMRSLSELAKLYPAEPSYSAALAARLSRAREFEKATAMWKSALRADPAYADAWNQLGYTNAWAGKIDEGLTAIAEYEKAQPDSPNPPDSRGEILFMAGRFGDAEKAFLASHQKSPNFNGGAALEKAALSRYLAGDARGAGDLLDRFLKQRAAAGDATVELRRAKWEYMFGMVPAAKARMARAMESGQPAARQMAKVYLSMWSAWERDEARTGEGALEGAPEPIRNAWAAAVSTTAPGEDGLAREMRGWANPKGAKRGEWGLLTAEQGLLFDWMVYPNALYWRGESALAEGKREESRRWFEMYAQYSEKRADHGDQVKRAKEAVRL